MRAHTAPSVGLYVASAIPRMKPPPTHVAVEGTKSKQRLYENENAATNHKTVAIRTLPPLCHCITGERKDANKQVDIAPSQ